MTTDIGRRLRELRLQAGLSIRRFANLVGVHRNTVLNYENEGRTPDLQFAIALRAAGLDWSSLVTGEEAAASGFRSVDWGLVREILDHILDWTKESNVDIPGHVFIEIIKSAYPKALAMRRVDHKGIARELEKRKCA